jgi:hypothetical protein
MTGTDAIAEFSAVAMDFGRWQWREIAREISSNQKMYFSKLLG